MLQITQAQTADEIEAARQLLTAYQVLQPTLTMAAGVCP